MQALRYLVVCAFVACFCFSSLGQPPSGASQELIIDQVKKTVVYLRGDFPCHEPLIINGIQAATPDGQPIFQTICQQVGTGFLISYSTPELGPDVGIPLLVTSKHLIQHPRPGGASGVMEYFENIVATANTKEANPQNSFISPIAISVKTKGFLDCSIDNKDVDADVAVCFISIPDSIFDFKVLGSELFITKATVQSLRLNETDEVLFSGLFLPYHGAQRNYPIVRHGKLALIPKEKIFWSTAETRSAMQDLYLAEITSWGGNSGSPVFVRLSGTREQGTFGMGVQYLLLGVMLGYFNADRPAALDTSAITDTAHLNIKLSDNSGIAAVVPAEKISDILEQPRIRGYVELIKANSYVKANNSSGAESCFKKAIEILQTAEPDHPLVREAYMNYASFLQSQGRQREAGFRRQLANGMNKINEIPDDQLR